MPAVFVRLFCRAALLLAAGTASAATCPAGEQEVCLGSCFCAPAMDGELGTLYEDVGKMAAGGLANWITQTRASVPAASVRPIPLHIRVQLEAWYDWRVLETVRYKVDDGRELSAANAVLQNPDVNAVTLVDLIVFRSAQDAEDNVALWAHELKHVEQYQQWGVEGFAARYSRDYQAIEAPAYAIQREVARSLKLPVSQSGHAH